MPISALPKTVDAFLQAGPEQVHHWVTRRQWVLTGFCVAAIVATRAFSRIMLAPDVARGRGPRAKTKQ